MKIQEEVMLDLINLMSLTDRLRDNQVELSGMAKNIELEAQLKLKAAELLGQIEKYFTGEPMAFIARLRREWILSQDLARQDEIAKQVFAVRLQNAKKGKLYFDIGHLVDPKGMQDLNLRKIGRRYAAWIYQQKYDNIQNSNGAIIQICQVEHLAGEAKRYKHISNFWPEDAGILDQASNYTTVYANTYLQRYKENVFPLLARFYQNPDWYEVRSLSEECLESEILKFICGHEFGHASGGKPLKLAGYGEFGGDYPVLEELRSDLHWLNQTLFLRKSFPDEQSWRCHQRIFWGEALHYVVRGLQENRSDSRSANMAFNFMIKSGAIQIDKHLQINFIFPELKKKIQDLHMILESLFTAGSSGDIKAFIAKYSTNEVLRLFSAANSIKSDIKKLG